MKIKLTLLNCVGHLDHLYLNAEPDLGGYVNSLTLPASWCLDHGDTIRIEFLDRLKEDGDLTAEDERVLASA